MISRVLSADLPERIGDRVTIAGWLHRRRELKSVTFLIIRDRAGLAQVVLPPGDRLRLPGRDRAAGRGPGDGQRAGAGRRRAHRARADRAVRPRGAAAVRPVPARRSPPTLPTILDHAPTTLRHPVLRAGLEISAASAAGFRAALDGLGFTEIFTPKIVESATESGANVFGLDYFGRPAYLAQSPQFYKQAMVGRVRARLRGRPGVPGRAADTARHLAEYTSLDAELGFITDHHDVMAVCRDAVAGMVASVSERARSGMELARRRRCLSVPAEIPQTAFRRRDGADLARDRRGRDRRA